MGGLINPRTWRRRCRASSSNTGGPPLPRKRAPQKDMWRFSTLDQKGLIKLPMKSTSTIATPYTHTICVSVRVLLSLACSAMLVWSSDICRWLSNPGGDDVEPVLLTLASLHCIEIVDLVEDDCLCGCSGLSTWKYYQFSYDH